MVTIDSTLCTGCGKCVADCIAKKSYASRRKKCSGTKKNVFYADIVFLFVPIMQ